MYEIFVFVFVFCGNLTFARTSSLASKFFSSSPGPFPEGLGGKRRKVFPSNSPLIRGLLIFVFSLASGPRKWRDVGGTPLDDSHPFAPFVFFPGFLLFFVVFWLFFLLPPPRFFCLIPGISWLFFSPFYFFVVAVVVLFVISYRVEFLTRALIRWFHFVRLCLFRLSCLERITKVREILSVAREYLWVMKTHPGNFFFMSYRIVRVA